MACLQVHNSLQSSLNDPLQGVIVAVYIRDIIATGDTYEECLISTIKTVKLLLKLGFFIHP